MRRDLVVVTGAGSGIGKAIARRFGQSGAEVVCVDLNQDRLDTAVWELSSAGLGVQPVLADVSTAAGATKVFEVVEPLADRFTVLVNNAGITRAGNLLDLREDEWDLVQRVNLKSVFLMSREAVRLMRIRGGGSIVNIASGAGLNGVRYRVAYGSSKAGVVNLTRCIALDHAQDGIRANVICPGVVDTEAMRKSFGPSGLPAAVKESHPLGRVASVEEIAEAAWFLASPEASFITGVALPVDGGSSAGHFGLPTGVRR